MIPEATFNEQSVKVLSFIFCFVMRGAYLPLLRLFFRIKWRDLKYDHWQAGDCRFYGPPYFLAMSSKAMERLSTLDQSLYQFYCRRSCGSGTSLIRVQWYLMGISGSPKRSSYGKKQGLSRVHCSLTSTRSWDTAGRCGTG